MRFVELGCVTAGATLSMFALSGCTAEPQSQLFSLECPANTSPYLQTNEFPHPSAQGLCKQNNGSSVAPTSAELAELPDGQLPAPVIGRFVITTSDVMLSHVDEGVATLTPTKVLGEPFSSYIIDPHDAEGNPTVIASETIANLYSLATITCAENTAARTTERNDAGDEVGVLCATPNGESVSPKSVSIKTSEEQLCATVDLPRNVAQVSIKHPADTAVTYDEQDARLTVTGQITGGCVSGS